MKKLLIIMVMLLLVLFCGITFHEKLLPDTVHPVEDEIEDTDPDLRPTPDGTGSEGTPSTSGTPSGSVDTDVPDVSPEVTPYAASTPDAASKPGEASKPDAASKSGEVSKPDAASKSGEASKPDAPSTPEAASKPETSVTPMPDSADTEQDSAAEQEYTGSLLGEPDTDF